MCIRDRHVFLTKIGTVAVDLQDLELLFPDTRYRILSYVVKWVSGNPYGARAKTLENTLVSAMEGKPRTCCGCVLSKFDEKLHISREFNAVKKSDTLDNLWDGRWSCSNNFSIKACGEKGLEQINLELLPRPLLHKQYSKQRLYQLWLQL